MARQRFQDMVVVVTGASSGVGRATARRFAQEGAHVALLARGQEGLEAARREVQAAGRRALVVPTDVADAAAVEAAADRIERELGPIDVWVNNAMVAVLAPLLEHEPADFKRVTDVTYLGVVHGTMSALRRMTARDRGAVVQVGSALAYRGIPLQSAYCGAKHAIQGFTESVRCELLHDKSHVRISMVQLPAVNTPQFGQVKTTLPRHPQPVPPIFQPEVAADAIVFAAGSSRREVWVGWPAVRAIVGNALAPSVADRVLAKNGYEDQQMDDPVPAGREHYLYDPLPGDPGAHGRFDGEATDRSPLLWAVKHREVLAGAATGAAALAAALIARR
jgi:NAD(P)-dependent dehydrogenase (short-subunit alcohol dehydrogenase family)